MKFITARQAWHDAFYHRTDSPIARAAEIARLGAKVQHTVWHNSTNRAAHVAQAGRILSAISSLPSTIQQLGHWLYAPLTADQQDSIINAVQDLIWCESGLAKTLSEHKREAAYWLIRAALREYQDLVLGRDARLGSPRRITSWLYDWHGVEISSRYWSRQWVGTWQRLWDTISDLDAVALAPVGAVLATSKAA